MQKTSGKIINKIKYKFRFLLIKIHQSPRIWKYRILSDIANLRCKAKFNQPTLLIGQGHIALGRCFLGVWPSPYFLNGYIHIEARGSSARIEIADGVYINNNSVILAERSTIRIGANTLIGSEFTVYDSDFHDIRPNHRLTGAHTCASVNIGKNVFLGSRVTVLKGVTIGDNAVIAAGSVVTQDVPASTVVGGVPARVICKSFD